MHDAELALSPTLIVELRADAVSIFLAGIHAANPFQAVAGCLLAGPHHLEISLNPEQPDLKRIGRWSSIITLAFGKAACAMADAVQSIIPEHFRADPGIVVTNYENVRAVPNFDVYGAGHPFPDHAGEEAAHHIQQRLSATRPGTLVLVLVSGGGSALLPSPIPPITLAEKVATTDLLLASGASIEQINCIRKHLSVLKGGGLSKLAAPADVHSLILSDVLSNDVSAIASGPTVPDPSTFAEALAILQTKRIWDKLPETVQQHLLAGYQGRITETPKPNDSLFKHTSYTLIGSNRQSLNAIKQAAKMLHYQTIRYHYPLLGEARLKATKLVNYIAQLIQTGINQPTAIVSGGETTVTLNGNGKGGRNQEFALAFALAAEQQLPPCWVLLSGGTDGRDGPTDAAGGLVDPSSMDRLRQLGRDPQLLLDNNDAYHALKPINDLLITGPTCTNVADLLIVLLHPSLIQTTFLGEPHV